MDKTTKNSLYKLPKTVKKNLTKLRVRYGDTDQMGVVYYGTYALYVEQGRTEWLRALGISYKWMEEHDIQLPVVHYSIDYKSPARYDDMLTIKTFLKEIPTVKIEFFYEIYNDSKQLLATAKTTLVFIDSKTGKVRRAPEYLLEKLT